jgi:hypothetical protein
LAFSYWTIKPWFLTEGKLLLCSSYLPLGVPNWSVIYISTGAITGYLSDTDWDHAWVPEDYSSGDEDEALEEDDDDEGTDKDEGEDDNLDFSVFDDSCQPPPPPQPSSLLAPIGSYDISGRVHEGTVVRDDTEDFVCNVAYNVLRARDNGKHYVLPPELMEEEEL